LRPGAFSPSDFQFLNTLMTYIGYRVQNAELKSQTTRSTIALEQTLDDLKNVQAQLVRGETLRAIGQLASGMAHHLNNLFMVISGRTQLLTANLADPDLLRHLGLIEQSVRDTVVGMSEEVRRRALEPFFTTKGLRSTGVGLSVNYGIVKRHGGDLTVDSALGKGSTVTFLLLTGGRVAHHASTSDPEPTPLRL